MPVHSWKRFAAAQRCIIPLQVPDARQKHSDAFSAAAVGFGTGHCKLGTRHEFLSGLGCRGKGLCTGSQVGKNISCSAQRADPTPAWEKPSPWQQEKPQLPPRAAGTAAGGMSLSRSRGWQAVLAEADSSAIQNPSSIVGAFGSRIMQGTV